MSETVCFLSISVMKSFYTGPQMLLICLMNDPMSQLLFLSPPLISFFVSKKILTMIPTEEEKQRIQEAQLVNPDIPLGSAEQFLLTLSSITELSARLQLWAFKMDYELIEKVRHIPARSNHMQTHHTLKGLGRL